MHADLHHIQSLQKDIERGVQKAFEELYRTFFPGLFNFAMQYLHRKELAEEVVNDVMIKVWKNRSSLSSIVNFRIYVFAAVRNQCINYISQYSSYRVTPVEDGNYELEGLPNPEKQLEWKEIYHELNKAVERLPNQCRTIFKLVKEEGFKYKQVAEILDISPRTVETQLFRAVKKLNNVLLMYNELAGSTSKRKKSVTKLKSFLFSFF